MSASTVSLPDFKHPPVVEVALSVQFSRLEALCAAHFGLIWTKFRPHGFTRTEDHVPIELSLERFDQKRVQAQVGVQVRAYDTPPLPRVWFLNQAGTELIQIQPDRFIRNWRKVNENDEYVRFKHIRERFIQELQEFAQFIKNEKLGDLAPNQCEVTYVNHIVSGNGWESHSDLAKVLSLWSGQGSAHFLPAPEGIGLSVHYVIPKNGEGIGRFHVELQPGYRLADEKPIYILNLTARGAPVETGIDGAVRFLDIGHEWIVRGFASMTTEHMHRIWGRTDVS